MSSCISLHKGNQTNLPHFRSQNRRLANFPLQKPPASKLIESYTSITILTQNGDDRSSTWRTSLRVTEDNSNLQSLPMPTLYLSKEHQFPASAQTSTDLGLRSFSHGRVPKLYTETSYLGRWDAVPAWACLPIYPFRSLGNGAVGTRIDSDDGIRADSALICILFFAFVSVSTARRCHWLGCPLRNAACLSLVRKCCPIHKG
jgi:hypothetical protein